MKNQVHLKNQQHLKNPQLQQQMIQVRIHLNVTQNLDQVPVKVLSRLFGIQGCAWILDIEISHSFILVTNINVSYTIPC